jgi:hypothetical protein
MGIKQVIVSDISGEEIDEADHARIIVNDHPALNGASVELDVSSDEAARLQESRIDLVSLSIFEPNRAPRRVVLDANGFAEVFKGIDIAEVLQSARQVADSAARGGSRTAATPRRATPKGDRVDYASLEHAGEVHRGRVTEAEASIVRDNLDEVNRRLESQGRPTIDPKDPVMKRRYGFS